MEKEKLNIDSIEIEYIKTRLKKIEKIIEQLAKNQKEIYKNLKKSMIHQRLIFEKEEKE